MTDRGRNIAYRKAVRLLYFQKDLRVTVNGANSNAISSGFYCFLRGYDLNIHFLQNDCLYNC